MLIAIDYNAKRISALSADKSSVYFCPLCKSELVLKQGTINIHHFAHKIDTSCDMGFRDMSEWHINWQLAFGIENSEKVIDIGDHTRISDTNLNDVFIEFQHSPISYKEIRKRTKFYTLDNRHLFWIFDLKDQYDSGKIYLHKKNSFNNFVFKWTNHNKALRGAEDIGSELLLQLKDDLIVNVKWMAYDNKLEFETLKVFAGTVMTKQQTIEYIKGRVNNNWQPTKDFEKSSDYQTYKERVTDLDNGWIV
jgi:competence CoiA-like predicted nuclease